MKARSQNILIFVLVLAGLLVAILYSPIGSPGDYTSLYYNSVNPGVQFNGSIANAPSSNHSGGNYNEDLLGTVDQPVSSITSKYSASGSAASDNSLGYASQINSGVNASKQSTANSGASGSMAMSYGSRRSGANSQTSQNQAYGFTSISSDLTATTSNNPTTKQSVGNSVADVTDPGGDPTGPPIPVGDGWVFLLFLAGGYVVMKRFVLKKLVVGSKK